MRPTSASSAISATCADSMPRSNRCAPAPPNWPSCSQPVPVSEVARIAFAGGVLPQKSTDFYPKLLSGLTIYKLD